MNLEKLLAEVERLESQVSDADALEWATQAADILPDLARRLRAATEMLKKTVDFIGMTALTFTPECKDDEKLCSGEFCRSCQAIKLSQGGEKVINDIESGEVKE